MAGFRKDDKDGQIKWLIEMNEKKFKEIRKLEKENQDLKDFINFQYDYILENLKNEPLFKEEESE